MTQLAVPVPHASRQVHALAGELDALLDTDLAAVRLRECSYYDQLSGGHGARMVLFGAGGLGREILRGLRALGQEPLAFTDNNRRLWGRQVDELAVLSPEEAGRRFGRDASFVVTVFTPGPGNVFPAIRSQLQALGCRSVVPFAAVAWKHPDRFLPNYCIDLPHKFLPEASAIRQAFWLLADDLSRREYLAQLRWRALLDFEVFSDPACGDSYFQNDLIVPRDDELLVDCGAFDGDTLRSFLEWQGERSAGMLAFEPDPQNFAKLTAWRMALPPGIRDRIEPHQAAVGRRRQKLRFAATGNMAAAVSDAGQMEIDCVALDAVLADRTPTFIKMDIEGAEPEALAGAAHVIRRSAPTLAVCAYHRQDHLWRIPLQIHALGVPYALFLRRHGEATGEVVCFARPRSSEPARKGE
jgi:FkbM family methyltransferase